MPLRLRTLNDRLILVISIMVLVLFGVTIYSHHLVQRSAGESLTYIEANRDLNSAITRYKDTLQQTESALYQYSSFLQKQHYQLLEDNLIKLNERAAEFIQLSSTRKNEPLLQLSQTLVTETAQLSSLVKVFLQRMHDVESRFPGMPILLQHLEPTNRQFIDAVEVALHEAIQNNTITRLSSQDRYHILNLFQEARYAWAMQVSWLRVFVANRMGAFGEPESAMRNNLKNRELYASKVDNALQQLVQYKKKKLLGLEQEESLNIMLEAKDNYNKYAKQAVAIYFSDDWRADESLLRDAIQPAISSSWHAVEQIENIISETYNVGITKSQNTAKALWIFIWVFAGTIFVMLLATYWVFQKKLRRPILQLADTMQQNQDGLPGQIVKTKNIEEINRLIDAYNDMQSQVANRELRLESILNNAAEGVITIDNRGKIESFNIAAQKLFGYKPKEIIGEKFEHLFSNEQTDIKNLRSIKDIVRGNRPMLNKEFEVHGHRKDGMEFFMSVKLSDMHIADKRYITAIVADISERRATMDRLRHMAEHDSLTGLHNRQYFNDELERFFAQQERRKDMSCACLYIDLDNFKYINDTLGHLEGDRLLIGIASALQARTRKSDVFARLGGDEFALLLVDVNEEHVLKVADAYRNAIANFSFVAGGKHIDTGCSIGVALYESDIETKDGLLARADIACHMAKRAGRNRVHLFKQEDKGKIDTFYEEMGWTRRIRYALENRGFVFSCQPILRVADESIYSHELLLRMLDPDSGEYIMPSGFLDSAERFGLMPQIDQWVIQHAFEWLNKQPTYNEHLRYFINLSGKSIGDKDILSFIRSEMPNLKIDSSRVVFEITEDVAIANLDTAKHFLSELRALGFKTAIDDFGVGYSSFSYLRELDVDFVKIDGSFINTMHTDEMNYALVKAINDICHILGKFTIAEFVQNDTALKLLKEIGVDFAQGYNIATAEDYDQHTIQFILP